MSYQEKVNLTRGDIKDVESSVEEKRVKKRSGTQNSSMYGNEQDAPKSLKPFKKGTDGKNDSFSKSHPVGVGRSRVPVQKAFHNKDKDTHPSKNLDVNLDKASLKTLSSMIEDKLIDRDVKLMDQMRELVTNKNEVTMDINDRFEQSMSDPRSNASIDNESKKFGTTPKTFFHNNGELSDKISSSNTYEKGRGIDDAGIKHAHCRSVVHQPTHVNNRGDLYEDIIDESSIPTNDLDLHHVYGYSGDNSRYGTIPKGKNVMFLDDSRIVFPLATLVVLMHIKTSEQHFFHDHTQEVSCVTLHPDRNIIASGQMGKDGRILVWDSSSSMSSSSLVAPTSSSTSFSDTMNKSESIELFLYSGTRGVSGVNFSGDGRLLVALGLDEGNTMTIFDWARKQVVASTKTGSVPVQQMGFNPFLYTGIDRVNELKLSPAPMNAYGSQAKVLGSTTNITESCCYTLISCGGRYMKFWTLKRNLASSIESSVVDKMADSKDMNNNSNKNVPKKKQSFSISYLLEGNNGVYAKKNTTTPNNILCFASIVDSYGDKLNPPKSRILTGTSTGSVYIWQQLEDTIKNNNSLSNFSWQPQGRLLSIISDVHDGPIRDLDYINKTSYTMGDGNGNGTRYNELFSSKTTINFKESNISKSDRINTSDSSTNNSKAINRLVTIGSDGVLNVWNIIVSEDHRRVPFEHVSSINIVAGADHTVSTRCLSWDSCGLNIIVGTLGNSILLVSPSFERKSERITNQAEGILSKEPILHVHALVQGHQGKILCVTKHPLKSNICATVSTDCSIRIWDLQLRTHISLTKLSEQVSTIEFTPDGNCIAVGTVLGELLIISYNFLNKLNESQQNRFVVDGSIEKQWRILLRRHISAKFSDTFSKRLHGGVPDDKETLIEEKMTENNSFRRRDITKLKYSPSGRLLAVGCRDTLIHILAVESYERIAVCRGHTSFIQSIDFSTDDSFLQSTDAAREILFWEAFSGKKIQKTTDVRDVSWTTWSSLFGWSVQGIFNNVSGGTSLDFEVSQVDRSNDGNLLLVGLKNAYVKLFKYPCLAKAMPKVFDGHASSVSGVAFLTDDEYAVTIGGDDASIFCYKIR